MISERREWVGLDVVAERDHWCFESEKFDDCESVEFGWHDKDVLGSVPTAVEPVDQKGRGRSLPDHHTGCVVELAECDELAGIVCGFVLKANTVVECDEAKTVCRVDVDAVLVAPFG